MSKTLPKKWSNEWEKVKEENPTLFNQVVSGICNQPTFISNENKCNFSNLILPSNEEDTSFNGNNRAHVESTVPRYRTVGAKKYDSNNNGNFHKIPLSTKPKIWDESTEKWIEVDGPEKS